MNATTSFLIEASGFILFWCIGMAAGVYGLYAQTRFFLAHDRARGWRLYFPGWQFQLDIWRGKFADYGGPVAQGYLARLRKAGMVFLVAWLLGLAWFAVMLYPALSIAR